MGQRGRWWLVVGWIVAALIGAAFVFQAFGCCAPAITGSTWGCGQTGSAGGADPLPTSTPDGHWRGVGAAQATSRKGGLA
jgi:hypothetical protein